MAILHVSHAQTKTPLKLEFSDAGDHQTSRTCDPIRWNLRSMPPANKYPASPTCCDGRKGFGCCWWPFLSSHLGRIPPKRFGTAEGTHHVFSGVVIVAQRQLSEGPSNPPRKHTSRYSHCVKPVATKVMFGSSMVSYQLGNQETLESKLWSSGKSWPKCTLQPPRRNISIIINLPHHRWPFRIKTLSKPYQCHISQQELCLRSSSCIPCNQANALSCSHRHTNTHGPNKGQSRSAVLTTEILYSSSSWRKTASVRLSQHICENTGPYHLLC